MTLEVFFEVIGLIYGLQLLLALVVFVVFALILVSLAKRKD